MIKNVMNYTFGTNLEIQQLKNRFLLYVVIMSSIAMFFLIKTIKLFYLGG